MTPPVGSDVQTLKLKNQIRRAILRKTIREKVMVQEADEKQIFDTKEYKDMLKQIILAFKVGILLQAVKISNGPNDKRRNLKV